MVYIKKSSKIRLKFLGKLSKKSVKRAYLSKRTFSRHLKDILETFRGHFGDKKRTFRGHLEDILETNI
jgi:hypothetical protein